MKRDSFQIYRSFFEGAALMENKADQADFLLAIGFYMLNGDRENPELTGEARAAFALIKPTLDKALDRAESGSKGGKAPNKQTSSNGEAIKDKRLKNKDEKIKDEINISQKLISDNMQEERFDKFWMLYPKKTGKKAAQSIWKRLNPNDELFNKIIASLETARSSETWKREKGKYIPNPTTWLNQGRWDDEPVEILVETQKDQWNSAENPWRK